MQKDKRGEKGGDRREISTSFAVGVIAIVFLIIGYQMALFVHRAAALKIQEKNARPDTVYIIDKSLADELLSDAGVRRDSSLRNAVLQGRPIRKKTHKKVYKTPEEKEVKVRQRKRIESFRFNPNTVSVEDLVRLGFSPKQAQSIENYRNKGGKFRRREDFAKSYVVSDSVFARLEPFIDIPKLDINLADSASFDALPGIGGYFAKAIVRYRERLGGSFSHKEQLVDVPKFGRERFDAISDLIFVSASTVRPYRLWSMPEDSLALHPYIGKSAAHGIVLYRENNPKEKCTVESLVKAGILTEAKGRKLSACAIVPIDHALESEVVHQSGGGES